MDRRTFVGLAAAGAILPSRLSALDWHALQQTRRHALRRPVTVSGEGLTLTARPARADVGAGTVDAWTINGSVPSPTIRLRQGQTARVDLVNELPEPTILHWHGLAVPQEADGHPRLAIDSGERYTYEYRILNRAGTYWYHPHPHKETAAQTYKGMGGFLIVEDDEEGSYELPTGEYEIPLVLQDKRIGDALSLSYDLSMPHDMMHGFLGNTAFANGVADATVDVRRSRYRLRILNGSNARIFDLGLSNGQQLTLIGSDGGLLAAPVRMDRIMLGPAERADVLVDFSARRPGERVMLRSFAFDVPGMMGMGMGRGGGRAGRGGGRGGMMMMGMGGPAQGTEMDLLEFVVQDSPSEPGPPVPSQFAPVPDRGTVAGGTPRQTFTFGSSMMMGAGQPNHTINGLKFEMERVDIRIRRMQTEVWTFVNDSEVPHPVHAHAGQFRVLSRTGGRARVMPWEVGLKDTVLTLPGETVDVAVRFFYEGLYLLHCHNLEHEDMDMMLNFEVIE
jgi:FtsP/CotA-like multicopper oxidase with cupredoxin domain